MTEQYKTREKLTIELQELQQKYDSLKEIFDKYITERKQAEEELKDKIEEIEAQNEVYAAINKEFRQTNEELIELKEQIAESETKYRLLANYTSDWEYWIKPDGEYAYISSVCEKTSGYKPEDFMKNKDLLEEITLPEYKKQIFKHITNKVEKLHHPIEFKILTADGKEKWISHVCQPVFDDNKKYVGNRGVNRDITASKQAEEKLQAKTEEIEAQNEEYQQINEELFNTIEKATESDRLKSAFLANMSHEIRTPMNGILGFSELLKGADLSGEQQQEYIHIIEKSGARMLNIINDIVSISKIESGIIDIYLSETDINNQLQFVYNSLKLDANNKKINLSFNCALTEKEAIIKTDSEKFYSILSNLVKNAIKYTDKGSVEFGYDKKSEIIEFFVKDTGIGISKDRQEAIFERFIQADIVDVKARQGAGLGLSIAKAYVGLLGGKIWVESEKGKGSTFYFTLPYNAKAEEKIAVHNCVALVKADNHFVPEVSKLKILIVEDDETSEMLITTDVEKFSKEIIKARDGFTSVEVCRNNPDIDLILMDIQMPVMNGYEATRQIRQFNKDVVIIAQTSFGLLGDKEKAIEAGCNDYIAKPIKKDELLSLIQKYFKK